MKTGLRAAGAGLLGAGAARRGSPLFAAAASAPPGAGEDLVIEIRSRYVRNEEGRIESRILADLALVAATGLVSWDEAPLDALTELFPGDPPVAVLVDPRSTAESTRTIAWSLTRALVDMGSRPDSVVLLGPSDDELRLAGYEIDRDGQGPLCHGTQPSPGYGEPKTLDGLKAAVRGSRAAEGGERRLAVVARLAAGGGGRMAPFVLDAALQIVDPPSRARALRDPSFGASLLASSWIGGRVGLVAADLIEIPLRSAAAEDRTARSEPSVPALWTADEIVAARSLFAVESIGHRIVSNALEALGAPPPPPHPILAAARKRRLPGADAEAVDWRKFSI